MTAHEIRVDEHWHRGPADSCSICNFGQEVGRAAWREVVEILGAWLDHWGDSRVEGWEPEQADSCWPFACVCGFIELIHRSRLAVGRPCCSAEEHPLLPPQPPIGDDGMPVEVTDR